MEFRTKLTQKVGQPLPDLSTMQTLLITNQTIHDLELLSKSHEELLAFHGWTALEGALLPSEFVASYVNSVRGREDFVGVWAVAVGEVWGSGGFKSAPVEGCVEIGYGVAPSIEGRGVGTAICEGLVNYAFSHGATEVIAHTLPEGIASQTILAKNGFTKVGEFQDPEDGLVWRYRRTP